MGWYSLVMEINTMSKFVDLTNKTFNEITVVKEHTPRSSPKKWDCVCSCGNKTIITGASLKNGNTKSCGCLRVISNTKRNIKRAKHNQCGTDVHAIWKSMRQRCSNKNHKAYARYGARNINVCKDWDNFLTFKRDMGKRPSDKHSIERRDNNGNYNKDNCYWATQKEQCRNRSSNRNLTLKGKTQCLQAWADEYNTTKGKLSYRLNKGLSLEEALL